MSNDPPRNNRFHYLYRDASNYKSWGSVVFAGDITDELSTRLFRSVEKVEWHGPVQFPENRHWEFALVFDVGGRTEKCKSHRPISILVARAHEQHDVRAPLLVIDVTLTGRVAFPRSRLRFPVEN